MMGYKEYTEIPFHLREYFESLAESNSLEEIPLEEINGFMQMMEEVEWRNWRKISVKKQ